MSSTRKKRSSLPVAIGKDSPSAKKAPATTKVAIMDVLAGTPRAKMVLKTSQTKATLAKTTQIKTPMIQTPQPKTLRLKAFPPKTLSSTTPRLKTIVYKALPDNSRQELERKIGHIFADPNLLWEALQAHGNGVVQIGIRKVQDGNKKMAMLGDTILQLAVLRDWFDSGDSRHSGNKHLCGIASNRNLDKCGRDNDLEKYVNPHKSFKRGQIPPKTMAATVEALLGAVFIDSGENLKAVKIAMTGLGLV